MIRVGISGWTYQGWRGKILSEEPEALEELAFASRELSSIEINGTHYSLQRSESFRRWREETPRVLFSA